MNGLFQKLFSSKLQIPRELDEDSLPFPIGSGISVERYNSFIESKEISSYKFNYKNGTVYIAEMCTPEHEVVIEIIGDAFRELCPRAIYGPRKDAPIQILGQPLHVMADGISRGTDLAIGPHPRFVPNPPIPHPGPPPSDIRGNSYARVIVEVAVSQSSSDMKEKCRLWKRQSKQTSGYDGHTLATRSCKAEGPLALPIGALYNANVSIDLYEVQQAVLMKQEK
ncbi:unnamed protein product [Rhizophagus irregularis]|nr:unnamed protein product [Rhizophagus irregularis]